MRESPPVRSFYNQKGMTEMKQPHRIWNMAHTRKATASNTCTHDKKYNQLKTESNDSKTSTSSSKLYVYTGATQS